MRNRMFGTKPRGGGVVGMEMRWIERKKETRFTVCVCKCRQREIKVVLFYFIFIYMGEIRWDFGGDDACEIRNLYELSSLRSLEDYIVSHSWLETTWPETVSVSQESIFSFDPTYICTPLSAIRNCKIIEITQPSAKPGELCKRPASPCPALFAFAI